MAELSEREGLVVITLAKGVEALRCLETLAAENIEYVKDKAMIDREYADAITALNARYMATVSRTIETGKSRVDALIPDDDLEILEDDEG